jgi:CheY-like chemotaxis protein
VRSATETEEPARRKLLIVRGTGETDDTLLDTLGRHAFSTRVVTRGTEAMEVAGTQVFDAIVLDLNLPDMDAGELLDAIRKTNGHASAPVVAVTALDDRRIVSGLPVQGFIERPVRPGPLIEALGRAGLRVSLGESVTTAGARERI